jgi:hypothetical protein
VRTGYIEQMAFTNRTQLEYFKFIHVKSNVQGFPVKVSTAVSLTIAVFQPSSFFALALALRCRENFLRQEKCIGDRP